MRRREFRPAMDGQLESRIVPAGHKAIVVTTAAYHKALTGIDDAVDRYTAAVIANRGQSSTELFFLIKRLQNVSKTLPYGQKVLLPALVNTTNAYLHAPGPANIKVGLKTVIQSYIDQNAEKGIFRYLQSKTRYTTDSDIPTQGNVPKGVKK